MAQEKNTQDPTSEQPPVSQSLDAVKAAMSRAEHSISNSLMQVHGAVAAIDQLLQQGGQQLAQAAETAAEGATTVAAAQPATTERGGAGETPASQLNEMERAMHAVASAVGGAPQGTSGEGGPQQGEGEQFPPPSKEPFA